MLNWAPDADTMVQLHGVSSRANTQTRRMVLVLLILPYIQLLLEVLEEVLHGVDLDVLVIQFTRSQSGQKREMPLNDVDGIALGRKIM